jgi:hypothetical protein
MNTPAEKQISYDNSEIALLRHTLATVAYRAGKALRGVPEDFPKFKAGPKTRTPGEILAHLSDLYDWALTQCEGREAWHDTPPTDWAGDTQRLFVALAKVDGYLASGAPLGMAPAQLFQGAIADSLAHIGQINILRGIAGSSVRAENYCRAEIVVGRVGAEQTPPKLEF